MKADDQDLEQRLRRVYTPLPQSVRSAALASQRPPRRLPAYLSIAVGLGAPALLAALLVVTLASRGGVPPRPQPPHGVVQALTAGPPAAGASGSGRRFVWLTGVAQAPFSPGPSPALIDTNVVVLDWTGAVRHTFQLPHSSMIQGFNELQAISADGTRALLSDGSVLDETGAVAGRISALATNGPAFNYARWMSDDSGVCLAVPSPAVPSLAASAGTHVSDHGVTLKVFHVDGSVRTVATVGTEPLSEPSGTGADTTSVLSCAADTNLAVVARYHDYSDGPAADGGSTHISVGLWTVRLSTGELLFHQPETRMALGRAFFFGSQNGRLAAEFLWNSTVAGSETDTVLQMPSGAAVPLDEFEASPDTPGLSADGTRILRRVVNRTGTQTDLKLIDARNGQVIRRVVISGIVGASAVAEPGGSAFMVDVDGHYALVDGSGGISILHPAVNAGAKGVHLPLMPGIQG